MNKELFDGISVTTAVGAFMGWLPSISAAATIVWMGIRIYETQTVQSWLVTGNNANG